MKIIKNNRLLFPDGTILDFDDGKEKTYDEKFAHPDLEDMMAMIYPLGMLKGPPVFQDDPGRFRTLPFFKKLYGGSSKEVAKKLVDVQWMPHLNGPVLSFTKLFGVADKMRAIITELEKLPEADKFFVSQTGGSFNFRYIGGTKTLSPHSFGIAVDIRVDVSHYWRWEKKGASHYKNKIPYSIVEIFEKYGFIWGGKWYHFDTMHFEYRPEILLKAGAEIRTLNEGNSQDSSY